MDGTIIRELREEKGISLNRLAQIAGVSKSYLSFIERGKQTNPSISVLERIAEALEIDVDVLLVQAREKEKEKLDDEIISLAKEITTSDLSNNNIKIFREFLELLKKN